MLFVNGIPLVVIENKSPNAKVEGGGSPVEQAISQMLRNQGVHEIPRLFGFVQLVLALAVGEAKYATVGTSAKYWAVWKEENLDEDALKRLVSQPLSAGSPRPAVLRRIRRGPSAISTSWLRSEAAKSPNKTGCSTRCVVPNDCWNWPSGMCCSTAATRKSPVTNSTSVCAGFWTACGTAKSDGSRRGGVVWHTQGSGKSLTMVMLAKGLALDLPREGADEFKIVLVTDRVDLDDQIYGTFRNCGTAPVQATTGRHLAKLLADHQSRIITIGHRQIRDGTAGRQEDRKRQHLRPGR